MKHVWARTKLPGTLAMPNKWTCKGCGATVSGNSSALPEVLARWDKVLEDCKEQLVREVLET